MSDIEFKGDTEKEKELNKEIFNCTLTIAQKDDEIRELKNQLQQKEKIIKEVREYINNNTYKTEWGDLEQDNEDININEDITEKEFIESLLQILKGEKNEETRNY